MRFNWARAILVGSFFLEENTYYHWHAFPLSDMELIADGICFLLLALCFEVVE
jgi:hypothetical protein